MNFTVEYKSISELISQLRAITAKDAITPEAVGYILQRIANLAHSLSNPSVLADAESVIAEISAYGVDINFNIRTKDGSLIAKKVTIPVATDTNAGIITADQFLKIGQTLTAANEAKSAAKAAMSAAESTISAANDATNAAKDAADAAAAAQSAAEEALAETFGVILFEGVLQGVGSSWQHEGAPTGIDSSTEGYFVYYHEKLDRLVLVGLEESPVTYYTHWSDANNFGRPQGTWGEPTTFKPFEHRVYSSGRELFVYDGSQMLRFADLTDASLHQAAFDAASVKTFNDLWKALGGTFQNSGYYYFNGELIGTGKANSYAKAVEFFIKKILDKGITVNINSETNMLEAGTADKTYLSIGPNAPLKTRVATDGSGNGVMVVGNGSITVSAGTGLENVKLKINKQTGMFTIQCVDESSFGQLAPITTGAWNTIGSSNSIASNVTLSDRATLNASVISYSATGLMSLRHVIDNSEYSGMEHLNIGGYNVIGSNNTLASNINIGDNVNIKDNVKIGKDTSIGGWSKITDGVLIGVEEEPGYTVFIGENAYIGKNAAIGEGGQIEWQTMWLRFNNVDIMASDIWIGYDTTIGQGVEIGAGTKLPNNFDGEKVLADIETIKAKLGLE